jgi:pSer/pThr/pTyr-binding forkhead associated (FHA) protein
VVVQDLESYNGTFVNGRSAAKPLPVQAGDELTLGPISFRVEMPCADLETAEAVLTQHEIELEASGQHESAPRR